MYLAYVRAARGRGLALALKACASKVHDYAHKAVEIDTELDYVIESILFMRAVP